VRDVYQADAGQCDWERGRLFLRRWRVYEFVYVVDNKNDHPIDHFYLEVRPPLSKKEIFEHFDGRVVWSYPSVIGSI
jgi:hypothetical protein